MYDNPSQNPDLMKDPRFKYYLLTCNWLKDVFEKVYGNTCVLLIFSFRKATAQ
jgi:hypothetical protein